jgi:AcrR family transcriptional regulator
MTVSLEKFCTSEYNTADEFLTGFSQFLFGSRAMSVGRPRQFDVDGALEKAMHVFWKRGYEGATLPELTGAMGINKPSLYATFGNKEDLFRRVLERYATGPAGFVPKALAHPDVRSAMEQLLRGAVALLTKPENPGSCLIAQGTLACSEAAEPIRRELATFREAGLRQIVDRLKRGQQDGQLPSDVDCADLGRYLATVVQGLGIQALGGATRPELLRVVGFALRAWPVGGS